MSKPQSDSHLPQEGLPCQVCGEGARHRVEMETKWYLYCCDHFDHSSDSIHVRGWPCLKPSPSPEGRKKAFDKALGDFTDDFFRAGVESTTGKTAYLEKVYSAAKTLEANLRLTFLASGSPEASFDVEAYRRWLDPDELALLDALEISPFNKSA